MLLLYIPVPLSFDQMLFFSILPISIQSAKYLSLDPDYVTGFSDAESSFTHPRGMNSELKTG
jgi:hypothetical protein